MKGDTLWVTNDNIVAEYSQKVIEFKSMKIGCSGDCYGAIFLKDYYEDIYDIFNALYNNTSKYIEASNELREMCKSDFLGDSDSINFLVAFKDKLYLVYPDFLITHINRDYYSIGSGREVANGAIEMYLSLFKEVKPCNANIVMDMVIEAVSKNIIDVGTK